MKMETGLIQIYTGDGKGKTTAALGLALRAIGYSLKVVVIEFMKESPLGTGELEMAKRLAPGLKIAQFGGNFLGGFTQDKFEEVKSGIEEGLEYARQIIEKRSADILILDEAGGVMNFKLADEKVFLDLIEKKPLEMELVLTGRNMPEKILKKADLVTEMYPVKHYFERGVGARKGIEY